MEEGFMNTFTQLIYSRAINFVTHSLKRAIGAIVKEFSHIQSILLYPEISVKISEIGQI
jgi:hypothetical protein